MRKLWQLYSTVNFFKEIKPFSDSVQQRVASPKIVYKRSLGEWEFLHLSSVVWTTRVSGVDYNTGKVLLNFPTLTGPNRDISTSPQIKLHVIFRHVFLPSPPTINVDMSAFWTHLLNIARAGEGRAEQRRSVSVRVCPKTFISYCPCFLCLLDGPFAYVWTQDTRTREGRRKKNISVPW